MSTFYSIACQQKTSVKLVQGNPFCINTVMKGLSISRKNSLKNKSLEMGMPRRRGKTRCGKTPKTGNITNKPVYYYILTTDWFSWYIHTLEILIIMFELV